MVVLGGIDSTGNANDSDFVAHMVVVAHTEADTSSNTDWVGTVQAGMTIAMVQPEPGPYYSLSMCLSYFPSRDGMLCNISLHVLLTYIIYKRGFPRYLLPFENINTPHRNAL